ncbi:MULTISPECIES: NADH-quinone oxidoreductase subunit L [Pelosinus]|jgi:NADH-quinone oxidoreductase subunit L|uniref:Proton-translocating NADH-quinone oxidoreductase, chain L n=1 Tax=Pelosinus fermentans B4 TaxID=1149862 RepID=I9AU02_9FIRM|nr:MULTISPECIES: NADH-quinone oxidoreductase subunit L [Pelosinus]MDF2570418.1 proton-translocating NADH-quinone oxidoreductase, chain [Sporomusa sp.]EIW16422.1 proton-translocating NADH-quinone oxidoreductase, chain L [Pelosinus fermentans B4]EIW22597.1 proton-translocating NADH-quinone oxidoreductase, chain L [Pelosinus fermentans A11]OAM95729.1 proton-translocating NADH-quinone oxidoreductase, chain L [Pelosinus fermentans DSM 17108]SDR32116.1 NADH dehydrogenase subunit L [Pelosinus ferment
MFSEYALQHAWLIPLLPALSFIVIGLLLRRVPLLSAAVAISVSSLSLVLAFGVCQAVLLQGITVDNPLIYRVPWVNITGLAIDMGVYIDPISAMMLMVVTLVSLMVQIYSLGYMQGDPGFGRFYAYLSLFVAAMLGLVIAVNFVQMFIFWELVGLSSYLLIGYYFYKVSAREAAKKAFITTRIGDFGLLLGILLLQIIFGTLDFQQLDLSIPAYIQQSGTGLLTIVGFLIFLGPISKSGQFPLHVWLPDAMEGPTPVSALIHAATMVVAGVYLVARVFFLFDLLPHVLDVVAWVGAITACFAASIALTQREIKRILAYSTVSQLGYMMLALGVGSVTASMFHLMTHAFFKALLFLAAGAVIHGLHDKNDIFEMGGLRHKMPVAFAAMTIGVLAISGIPPFAGFFSKDEILLAVSEVSLPLYVIAVITSAMTAFYMARLLIIVFFGPEKPDNHPHEAPLSMCIPLGVLGVLAIIGGYIPYSYHFGDWVRFGAAHHAELSWNVAALSTVLAILAMALAWLIYGSGRISSDQLAWRFLILYKLSYHKYYIDEIYQWLNQTVVDGLGKLLYWIDLYIVDGIVNGLAKLTLYLGDELRKWQTGQVQQYGMVLLGAILLLVVWLVMIEPAFKRVLLGGAG